MHPRTRQKLADAGLLARIAAQPRLRLVDPLGYLDFLKLMAHARVVLTDSGGIQEETTILGVPCLTLRENTERPVTVDVGTNRLVGQQPERILAAYRDVMAGRGAPGRTPPLWDGGASGRIVEVLRKALCSSACHCFEHRHAGRRRQHARRRAARPTSSSSRYSRSVRSSAADHHQHVEVA